MRRTPQHGNFYVSHGALSNTTKYKYKMLKKSVKLGVAKIFTGNELGNVLRQKLVSNVPIKGLSYKNVSFSGWIFTGIKLHFEPRYAIWKLWAFL